MRWILFECLGLINFLGVVLARFELFFAILSRFAPFWSDLSLF